MQRSIGDVAAAAAQIAAGRYDARVPDPGLGGEFASLALTYNRLAEKLEATESTRRSMLADLAHEMRTPLATIDAHLEAVEDGVRALDDDTLGIIRGSTGRLRRLAEDMTAVSQAEEGLDVTLRPMAAADVAAAIAGQGFTTLGVRHAEAAGRFAADHRDPFDRMLAAQSRLEGVPLVTNNDAFEAFAIERFW